ncbi:exocyst complex component 4 [Trichonephila clavipes]|nr:exocyst complex component 4 [Trichonephila clavipes]
MQSPLEKKKLLKFIPLVSSRILQYFKSSCRLLTGPRPAEIVHYILFLIDCVKVFLDQVSVESNRLLERITTSLETWQPVIDPEEYKLYEAKTPVLKSTLAVNSCLIEMEEFINALPDYSSYFLQLMCHILQSYKDLSYGAYKNQRGLPQGGPASNCLANLYLHLK